MLQVVVKPSYRMVLEAYWYDHFVIITEYFGVFNQLGGVPFLFNIGFEVFVLLFYLSYLYGSKGMGGVFLVLIHKHKVHGFHDVCFLMLCAPW